MHSLYEEYPKIVGQSSSGIRRSSISKCTFSHNGSSKARSHVFARQDNLLLYSPTALDLKLAKRAPKTAQSRDSPRANCRRSRSPDSEDGGFCLGRFRSSPMGLYSKGVNEAGVYFHKRESNPHHNMYSSKVVPFQYVPRIYNYLLQCLPRIL